MIKTKSNGELIVISGTTCAGKGTIIRELLKNNENLYLSISYTSRGIRPSEEDGKDYYFVTKNEFETKIKNNEFLEYALVRDKDYYGTPIKEVNKLLESGKDIILEIDVEGARQIKEKYPETLMIFILAPSMSEVKRRIIARNAETKEQIIDRFVAAYKEIDEINKYNYVVVNDNVDDSIKKIESIIIANKCRVDRIEEMSVENKEEFMHELIIGRDFDNNPIKYGE